MYYKIKKISNESYNLIELDTKRIIVSNCKSEKELKNFLGLYVLVSQS